MKLHILVTLAIISLALSPTANAQDLQTHTSAQTSAPSDSRFEII